MIAAAGLLLRGRAGIYECPTDVISVMIRTYHDAADGDLQLHQMAARRAYLGGMRFRLGALKMASVIAEDDAGDITPDDFPSTGVHVLRCASETVFLASIMAADPRALSFFEFEATGLANPGT